VRLDRCDEARIAERGLVKGDAGWEAADEERDEEFDGAEERLVMLWGILEGSETHMTRDMAAAYHVGSVNFCLLM
jgi:hypothetical protein